MNSQTVKKQKIPKAVKDKVWEIYFGNSITGQCYICSTQIKITNHDCGHIVPEARGGHLNINNLKPICKTCNCSMGVNHMEEFKKMFEPITIVESADNEYSQDETKFINYMNIHYKHNILRNVFLSDIRKMYDPSVKLQLIKDTLQRQKYNIIKIGDKTIVVGLEPIILENNSIELFVTNKCVLDPKAFQKATELYAVYAKYCSQQSAYNKTDFKTKLLKLGNIDVKKRKTTIGYVGIRLKLDDVGEDKIKSIAEFFKYAIINAKKGKGRCLNVDDVYKKYCLHIVDVKATKDDFIDTAEMYCYTISKNNICDVEWAYDIDEKTVQNFVANRCVLGNYRIRDSAIYCDYLNYTVADDADKKNIYKQREFHHALLNIEGVHYSDGIDYQGIMLKPMTTK